jgi:hypothetical protein
MLKMIEAFSYASEYCEVGLCVKASNLDSSVLARRVTIELSYHVKEILM